MATEFILRPARENDLPQLEDLVRKIAGGMTTLPSNPGHLAARIDDSLRAFDSRIRKPGGEAYLFVLEDLSKQRLIGTSGIVSRVGGFDPFYTYVIKSYRQAFEPLNIHTTLRMLELLKNHKGPTEICSLFLHPDYRRHGLGKLLSLSRFCFMKAFPERFDDSIIVELRGYIDKNGQSPFWEAVGKNFFWKDYRAADLLSGIGEKDFIEALMPKHPLYINLLPPSAQAVIGKVHPQTEPAKSILIKEGFSQTDEVDIFDAGPILWATREDLKSWTATHPATATLGHPPEGKAQPALISSHTLDFRATVDTAATDEQGRLILSPATAGFLGLKEGQDLQYMFL